MSASSPPADIDEMSRADNSSSLLLEANDTLSAECPAQALVGDNWFRAVLCCLYSVIFVFGVVGNVLVVIVSRKTFLCVLVIKLFPLPLPRPLC